VKRTSSYPKIVVAAGGRGVVGHAGTRVLADLAEATGLSVALSEALAPLRQRDRGHDPGRVALDAAVMLADGGEAIADLAVLRDESELFGPVASDPTAWRVLDGMDTAALERIRAARARAREVAWAQAAETGRPALSMVGGFTISGFVLDIDATMDAAIMTVSADGGVGIVGKALHGLPVEMLTDPDRLCAVLPIAEQLGPASLAYLDERDFQPIGLDAVDVVSGDDADLAALLTSVTADEADECGLADITSDAFVVRYGTQVVAAAGYRRWPGLVAHVCLLTAPTHRGRGLARVVACAAVTDGLMNHLLPQWRARRDPSRRVARALGFRQLGVQLSIRITA